MLCSMTSTKLVRASLHSTVAVKVEEEGLILQMEEGLILQMNDEQ